MAEIAEFMIQVKSHLLHQNKERRSGVGMLRKINYITERRGTINCLATVVNGSISHARSMAPQEGKVGNSVATKSGFSLTHILGAQSLGNCGRDWSGGGVRIYVMMLPRSGFEP